MNLRLSRTTTALAAVVLLALAWGCSDTAEESPVCDQAVTKWKECSFPVEQKGDVNCTGQIECVSTCAVNSTCEEMNSNDPDSAYAECTAACGQ